MNKKEYLNNKTFCMLPWTHMHMWPNGDTYPCCLGDSRMPVGSSHKNTMQEIWNNGPMRKLRKNMLAGEKSPECRRCYEQEEHGINTLRISSNKEFADHWNKVEETEEDGSAGMVNMAYLDIRFSNFCNLRCRTCGPNFSTSWYNDHVKLYGDPGIPQLLKVNDDGDKFFKELEPMLLDVEKVYFAGGEAIITEYWNEFERVNVAASLDANWGRGEYLRKNLKWTEIVNNRIDMIQESPHVEFWITPTVSAYNAFNLPDFHKEWIEEELLKPENFRINPLLDPEYMRVQILPRSYKMAVATKYKKHIEYLKQFDNTQQVQSDYESLIDFLWADDKATLIDQFMTQTELLDNLREEGFSDVFPELSDIKIKYNQLDFWVGRE